MAGFIRRYSFVPTQAELTKIEGAVIIDLPPPGAIEGVDTGVACIVGEFADCSYAVEVDGTGAVSSNVQPQGIFSGQDYLNKFGGFDPTIGDFGDSEGNGFVSLRSKRYSSLIISPVNLASSWGCRFFRELPLSTSYTDTLPVVPVSAASLPAGTEFVNGTAGRLRTASSIGFTALPVIAAGISGQTLAGASAVTQVFTSAYQATKVWQVDDSGPTYVDMTAAFNNNTDNDVILFPATEAVDDYFAVGSVAPFDKLTLDFANGTQGAGGTVAWEYSQGGGSWAALTNVSDGTSGFTAAPADSVAVTWDVPSDWAPDTISGVSAYYVRARVTQVYTTNPQLDQGFLDGTDWFAISRPDGGQGAKKGDIIVVGNNNSGAKAPLLEAGTYRVAVSPTASTINLTVERLNGQSFTWTAQAGGGAGVPWRLHVSSDADSAPVVVLGATQPGGYKASESGGASIPVRPLTDENGADSDGTWAAFTLLSPLVVPEALTGSTAAPLSGLGGITHPTQAVDFDASIQLPNAVSDASLDARYQEAIDATISDQPPICNINIIWAARTSALIRSGLRQNANDASTQCKGRMAVIRPDLGVHTTSDAISSTSPGVGATRAERVTYSWPGMVISVPEAVDIRLKTADGLTTIDGQLDVGMDSIVASLKSNLPPERNIGQGQAPVPQIMAPVLGIQRGVAKLTMNDYIALKEQGIAALRITPKGATVIQSGVTSSLVSTERTIQRRRMADFINDSVADRLVELSKLPLTDSNKDTMVGEVDAFLGGLKSTTNPAAQRIADYSIDDKSGNTPESLAANLFFIISKVRLIPTGDVIVFQTEIGNNVVITNAV